MTDKERLYFIRQGLEAIQHGLPTLSFNRLTYLIDRLCEVAGCERCIRFKT